MNFRTRLFTLAFCVVEEVAVRIKVVVRTDIDEVNASIYSDAINW